MPRQNLGRVSTSELQRELNKRKAKLQSLVNRRNTIAAQLANLESEINALGGLAKASKNQGKVTRGRRRGRRATSKVRRVKAGGRSVRFRGARTRAANSMTLTEALKKVLKGKTMGVTEVAKAVQKAGYKTNSNNFRTIVNQTLIKNPKMFKKPARGQYTKA